MLALGGAALAAGCGTSPPKTAHRVHRVAEPRRHRYGDAEDQFGELTRPKGASRGTVVVIHGGFWKAEYDLSLGRRISADLVGRGWTTWNVEYRRLGNGGGWPTTFTDVAAAIDHLESLPGLSERETRTVVTLGHSAGGQLSVWAATRDGTTPGGAPAVPVTAAISQAGVLDLSLAYADALGGPVVGQLLGGSPAEHPDRYALVDPIERLPVGVPVRCIHGTDDDVVPLSQSRAYVDAARGSDVRLVTTPGDHYAQIDPSTPAWRKIVATLDDLVPAD